MKRNVIRPPPDERPILLVVVDTEEEFDWSADFKRESTGVEHMRSIGLLQSVFDEFKIRPVYVIDHPIASQATSAEPLRAIHESGRAEIGAHLHPWVSPPFDEEVNRRNSYPGNLPRELERAKLTTLTQAIERGLGLRPKVYKAGRYGFGPNTPAILEELGFEVDLSPCPPFDFTADGGPDYSTFTTDPFWLGERRRLLSIPTTGGYVGFVRDGAHGLYRLATRPALRHLRLPGILARLGAVERLHLSPEGYLPEHHRSLTRTLFDGGIRTFTFALHSPSIQPGCTPYVQSEPERVQFLDSCRRYFEFFLGELNGVSMTALELKHRLENLSTDDRVKILGISPLDKDATASLVEDGRILFAAGEERFSRVKQHAGFPAKAIEAALNFTGTDPREIDVVAYPFLTWDKETELIQQCLSEERKFQREFREPDLQAALARAEARVPNRTAPVHGLSSPNKKMEKGSMEEELFYRLAGGSPTFARGAALRASRQWAERASADHKQWQGELESGLARLGLTDKLKRGEHHLSHAANAYLASGFDRAVCVTIDGYGTGLAGSVSLGEGGKLKRLHNLRFPHSLGSFYEMVTSSLGFHPDRHAGKIVGLAAYGDPQVLSDVLLARIQETPGDFKLLDNLNVYFSRHLSTRFPMIDLAAAWQHVLEVVAVRLVRHWVLETKCANVVLSGGVTANVKMNQRIHEIDEVEQTFVYPNMGDGGCGTGLAMLWSLNGGLRETIHDAYLGPTFSKEEIKAELDRAGLAHAAPENFALDIARRIHQGEVIGRFDGRMEYGPRALGNRTIMYHAREPDVNQWLNKRLGRTEFMPFAPVTLWEARERCYVNLAGAEHTAEFMTMTFDCTEWMKQNSPAAVHVDGTARPQLIRRELNPGYYDILKQYEKLSGIPSLINTSFNMHEEPIVCSPADAVRAFLQGNLDGLAIGPYFVPHPSRATQASPGSARKEKQLGAV